MKLRDALLKHLAGWFAMLCCVLLVACAQPQPPERAFSDNVPRQPEATSGSSQKPGWSTATYAIATSNPLATDAGDQVLRAGGNAMDAAVAVQMALALVEPQSSGIGGGAFLLHFDGREVRSFDGRETAPQQATPQLFLAPDGKPIGHVQAVVGGRAVGVPGVVRMLALAHRQHGKLPWASLFEPAIRLAQNGFRVSTRLHALLSQERQLKQDPAAKAYFYDPEGKVWAVGHLLKNPELAAVLQRIATEGDSALMQGDIAQAMVDKVRNHAGNPGLLSLTDLASYQAKQRAPLCFDYAAGSPGQVKNYAVCGMGPPSSGAIAVGQILGLLGPSQASPMASALSPAGAPDVQLSADWLHRYTEASRLAFADRAQFLADPDFVDAPGGGWQSLLAPAYLAQRAQLISVGDNAKSMNIAQPGQPAGVKSSYAPMPSQPEYGTSHISIIDSGGQAVAMTTSIESAFGSRLMVKGFMLNNELTDFSFAPTDANGVPIANRVQPGKRPLSSMSPTLVIDKDSGKVLMSLGGAGGPFIIHQAAKMLYATFNWGLNVQQAANLPNFSSLNGPTLLEKGRFDAATIKQLKAMGHSVLEFDFASGVTAIQRTPNGLFGGVDPRREGLVMGD